ncbi:uncharacterized protein I303_105080 [Kwoniella dejecticola CBS 10117]|uniref:Uncharacterized protein n=1 Tax=Kwoniella dejecticola CBS 10117 TaxID=1296121 RepID=A0A1A6A3I1_9TREE|nr:uncharacterized protein I303_05474 [Kwoniella dejecticola CBS 10117]OBR84615.1 hypothetical protein I303_05474 [Kwoniella dejecticola CBS 10117]
MSETSVPLPRWSQTPILTPQTAKTLIETISVELPSSTTSPDSSYSAASPDCQSPNFPSDVAFEFDNSHEEIQTSEYDEIREQLDGEAENDEGNEWNGPSSWGGRRPSWALSATGGAGGSVISISPRGSLSTRAGSFSGSIDSRRGSMPKAPKLPYEARRQSNPSLLGFDLAESRRRSSARSLLNGTRRRSSGISYRSNSFSVSLSGQQSRSSSIFDPIEESRLRNFASLELLRRRFSEVVEVTPYDDDSDGEENLDRAWDYQGWSPYSRSDDEDEDYHSRYESDYDYDEDESEVHTESYVPSPEMRNASAVPSLYSNFPLASVAIAPTALPEDGSSEISSLVPSPLFQVTRFMQPTTRMIGTPPAPPHPSDILRNRTRPALTRAVTSYVAPHTVGVPPGAAPPRPGLARSVSNPLISSASSSSRVTTKAVEIRSTSAGSFPVARTTPLGVSPLRESLRRQSVVSESEASRKNSIAERRRSSLAPVGGSRRGTRGSMNSEQEASRRASLAERRISLVKESAFRRMSNESRRSSKSVAEPSRKSSQASSRSSIRGEARRESSKNSASRQSSVVSVGEYGYLAPQIVIDTPKHTPSPQPVPLVPSHTSPGTASHSRPEQTRSLNAQIHRLRSNAPPSIVLPAYSFPAHTAQGPLLPTSTISPTSATPRFNPLSYFLNNDPSPTSISPLDPMVTPTASKNYFPATSPKSPRIVNVMDRGRPIASPEFASPDENRSLPYKSTQPPSPKSSTIPLPALTPTTEGPPEALIIPKSAVVRKAAPELSDEDLKTKRNEEATFRIHKEIDLMRQLNTRRGGTSPIIPQGQWQGQGQDEARIVDERNAKKTISIEDMRLVLVDTEAQSGETGHTDPAISTSTSIPASASTSTSTARPGIRRQATDGLDEYAHAPAHGQGYTKGKRPSTSRGLSQLSPSARPNFSRGISAPVLISSTNPKIPIGDYAFPTPSSPKSTKEPPKYQFPSPTSASPPHTAKKTLQTQTQTHTQLQLPTEPTLSKRRSITFVEPSLRSSPSRPKLMDRTSSFTRFFTSKSSKNNTSGATTTSSSSSSGISSGASQ